MIPIASILGQFVPTPERYKMPPTEFESVLPVKSYIVGHEGQYFSNMIPMASILGQFVPTPKRYKMPPTEFESVLPVKSYRVEGRGT